MKHLWDYQVSDQLPVREWYPSDLQLRLYAEASGDFNPIHLDDVYARAAGFDGVIAQGMLTMAQLGALLTGWMGEEGILISFEVRFNKIVRVGERILCTGIIKDKLSNSLTFDLWAVNVKGEKVISGSSTLLFKTSNNIHKSQQLLSNSINSILIDNGEKQVVRIIDRDLIGRESNPVRVKIEANEVRKFTEAVGIPFEDRVPPTFFVTFMKGSIEGIDLFQPGTIQGEQKFTYLQPISVGDEIVYTRRIKDIFERSGNLGQMIFVVVETTGCNNLGEEIFIMSSTIIFLDRIA